MSVIVTRAGKGSSLTFGEGDANFTNLNNDKAETASPTFTGTPTAPTASAGTSTTQIATTAFVTTADNLKAPLASPSLTGTPTAPTAAAGTSNTQIATTAFAMGLSSPAFTGTPTAPTAAAGTNTTQLATTAFVASAGLSSALPGQVGHANQFIKTDGTTATWQYLLNWTLQAVSLNPCIVGTAYAVRTNLSALTMTLPALPNANDIIYFMDTDNNAAVNGFIIARNGNTIMGLSEDMTVNTNGVSFALQYINGSWRLV